MEAASDVFEADFPTNSVLIFTTNFTPLIDYLQDAFNYETTLRLLNNPKEQQRINQIKTHEVKAKALVNSLFTRWTLNSVIYRSSKSSIPFKPFNPLPFTYNKFGKPLLKVNGKEIQFNSSSSNTILSIAIEFSAANSPIGIDLSHSKQDSVSATEFMSQFGPMFHHKEIEQLMSINNVDRRYFVFNHFWTLKEAFTKLLGSGLNIELSDFYFELEGALSEVDHSNQSKIHGRHVIFQTERVWYDKTRLNIDALLNKQNQFIMKLQDRGNFYCHSTVINPRVDDDLPVILTFITQSKDTDIVSFEVSMVEVLNAN